MKLRRVYVFGAGKRGQRVFDLLSEAGTEILGFIDNAECKQGTIFCGRKVFSLKNSLYDIKH